jgi:hypothetical protein
MEDVEKHNMTHRNRILSAGACGLLVLAFFGLGCSNKGKYAGKVEVVVGKNLQAKGVSLVDWRYSESQKSFGIKLKAAQPVEKHTYLEITGPGIGRAGSPIPMGESINKGEWIDFGGTKALGNPFEHFPDSGTITIDTR